MTTTINASTSAGLVNTADTSGILQFQTNGTATATIDTSGNVGIGTTSPTSFGANTHGITLDGTGNYQHITWKANGTIVADAYTNGTTGFFFGTEASAPLQFQTAGTERMRIDSSGNVLVNATAQIAGEKLQVSAGGSTINTAYFNFTTTDDRGNIICKHARATGATTGQQIAFLNAAGTNVGAVNSTTSATSYATSSDYRLKENVQPMVGALDKVAQLKPVTYTWKIDGSDGQGFIAHELQEIVPDAVTGEKDAVDDEGKPVYQGIDTSFLVATLTAAIKEQQTIINDLKARIETLEGAK